MRGTEFDAWAAAELDAVEAALDAWVPADAPAGLGLAMRYGVLDGGKRLRPLLVLAAARAVDGQREAALRAACAVELIHAYSLVHDDMPCMDNDVLRRGKPTVHVQFGEAAALLAGDTLQALAFELLTPDDGSVSATSQATLCRLLARAAGRDGMAGGQAIDLASVGVALRLFSSRPTPVRQPLAELGESGSGGRVTRFRLHAPAARSVALAGDFTDWQPRSMARKGADWTIELTVPPGVHHFAFLVNGKTWTVPREAQGVSTDEWGRRNATIVVDS